jgi:hypothetical protein
VQIKTFPSEIRENEKAQIKSVNYARGVKAQRHKMKGI